MVAMMGGGYGVSISVSTDGYGYGYGYGYGSGSGCGTGYGYGSSSSSLPPQLPPHVKRLSSLSNAFVKHAVKLRQSPSYRHASTSLLLVGDVPLRELCDISVSRFGKKTFLKHLFVLEGSHGHDDLAEVSERVVFVTCEVMKKLSGVDSIQGLNAIGITSFPLSFCSLDDKYSSHHEGDAKPSSDLNSWCPSPQRLLVLDGIQDPGNLGTLVRTAAAFDWDGVFLMNGCCDPFNEKALRASRGACFWIPIACGNWNHLKDFATSKKMKLYAGEPANDIITNSYKQDLNLNDKNKSVIDVEGANVFATNLNEDPMCLVLGSEGQGLSPEVKGDCSSISIPMPGRFESLNVAVAGGILLYLLQKKKSVP